MTLRTGLAGVLASAIGLLPLAPREHVHEVEGPNGQHQAVAHRHAASHRAGKGHTGHHESAHPGEADHEHAATHTTHREDVRRHGADHPGETHDDAIDHADSVVTQIDAAFTVPEESVPPVPVFETSTLAAAPIALTRAAHEPFVERLIHGPPATPTAPRPPPSSPRL